ncbi:hypothetical protein EK21DRAFT_83944 [Setomelanomma holmii]|uniref:DUF2470 domain-containing protein n=1 Tax=Setomelanomma holmii TaxID=210430 RepID=A0A9P4LTX5_9PLEO|nr:hypothetical protein EK21DRAFT_83944 [Setomelanomma holmii]
MAATKPSDDAIRQRIIKHMNADHQDSVRRYLEAYSNKSIFQTRNARMIDISLDQMEFDCNGQQHTVTFDPPMKSLSEARERVVQLDKEALKKLGRSDITIDRYIPPATKLGHLFNFSQCLFSYLFLPSASNWQPGSLLYDNLLYHVPNFAAFVAQIGWWVVVAFMIPIHFIEAGIIGRRLRKQHGLTPLDGVWWAWTASCFVEGFTAMWRLDSLVEEKRKEKDVKRH